MQSKINGAYADVVGIFAKKNGVYKTVADVLCKASGIYASVLLAPETNATIFNTLAIIGDSRQFYGHRDWFKGCTISDYKGLSMSPRGGGVGITVESSVGSLEYRASDASLRWTAPSDSAGPWVAIGIGGLMTLQSGTADKWLMLSIRPDILPSTDQVISTLHTGSLYKFNNWEAAYQQALAAMRQPLNDADIDFIGHGGLTTASAVALLPAYASHAGTTGYDIYRNGTNDISTRSISAETMLTNSLTALNARYAQGRKIVVVGEHARWGAAVGTPITAGQLTTLLEYNAGLQSWCAARPQRTRYLDAYTTTVDTGFSDGRPISGMLADTVHDGVAGSSIVIGNQIATALQQLGLANGPYSDWQDAGNLFTPGEMQGTSGVVTAPCTGTAPTSITVSRAAGTTAAAAVSIQARADGGVGNWVKLIISATNADEVIQCRGAATALATLGLVIGDNIRGEADIDIVDATNLRDVYLLFAFAGATTIRAHTIVPAVVQQTKVRTPEIAIPPGTTTVNLLVYCYTKAGCAATVRVSNMFVRKIT